MIDDDLTATRWAADRQIAHVDTTLDRLLLDVGTQLDRRSTTDAWASISLLLRDQLNDRPEFLGQMLARLAIRHLENSRRGPTPSAAPGRLAVAWRGVADLWRQRR